MQTLMEFCYERGGESEDFQFIGVDEDRVLLRFKFPLAAVIADFHQKVKEMTKGLASFDYEACGWHHVDLVKGKISLVHQGISLYR